MKKEFETLEFAGKWAESFGQPPMGGTWVIKGDSYNGKTSFTIQLAKYLTNFHRVAFNSIEEGVSLSFQKAAEIHNLKEVSRKMVFLHKENLATLAIRLRKRKSPRVVIIDSAQYIYREKGKKAQSKHVQEFLAEFEEKHLFIFTSHIEGRKPKGTVADDLWYNSNLKIDVTGYVARVQQRGEANLKPFVIWEEKAKEFMHDDLIL